MMDGGPVLDSKGRTLTPKQIASYFEGFVRGEVLLEYDFPRVFSAVSPEKEPWLFKWCSNDGEDRHEEVWLAFRTTPSRLHSLVEGDTSLREVISLSRNPLLLLRCGGDPLSPTEMVVQRYEKLRKDFIPTDDVSFKDFQIRAIAPADSKDRSWLGVRLHILTEDHLPLQDVSIPKTFQDFISATAHKLAGTAIYPAWPADDWSVLGVTRLEKGSLDLECSTKGPHNVGELTSACALLGQLVTGQKDFLTLRNEMGQEGFLLATSFLKIVKALDLSLALKWATPENPNNYVPIDKPRAERVLDAMDQEDEKEAKAPAGERGAESETPKTSPPSTISFELDESKIRPITRVTMQLTPEEAAPIRKEAAGIGGMQSLLRELQVSLQPDNSITLTPYQVQRILKYTSSYGQGGFQGRLRGLANALRRVGLTLSEL
jgi:hypothetical protein